MIKIQAWADSHVNFPYHARAPLRVIGYDTVTHQMYQPSLPKVHKQKNLAFIFFAATITWSLLMF